MTMEERIKDKLAAAFRPSALDVINESHMHHGHAGSPNSGQSHFRVMIVADAFTGRSRVDRHRLVNSALAAELTGGVHALAIKALAPDEAR